MITMFQNETKAGLNDQPSKLIERIFCPGLPMDRTQQMRPLFTNVSNIPQYRDALFIEESRWIPQNIYRTIWDAIEMEAVSWKSDICSQAEVDVSIMKSNNEYDKILKAYLFRENWFMESYHSRPDLIYYHMDRGVAGRRDPLMDEFGGLIGELDIRQPIAAMKDTIPEAKNFVFGTIELIRFVESRCNSKYWAMNTCERYSTLVSAILNGNRRLAAGSYFTTFQLDENMKGAFRFFEKYDINNLLLYLLAAMTKIIIAVELDNIDCAYRFDTESNFDIRKNALLIDTIRLAPVWACATFIMDFMHRYKILGRGDASNSKPNETDESITILRGLLDESNITYYHFTHLPYTICFDDKIYKKLGIELSLNRPLSSPDQFDLKKVVEDYFDNVYQALRMNLDD